MATIKDKNIQLTPDDEKKLQNIVAPVKKCASFTGQFKCEAKVQCLFCSSSLLLHDSNGRWVWSNFMRHISQQHFEKVSEISNSHENVGISKDLTASSPLTHEIIQRAQRDGLCEAVYTSEEGDGQSSMANNEANNNKRKRHDSSSDNQYENFHTRRSL